jgi:hypothetical protein
VIYQIRYWYEGAFRATFPSFSRRGGRDTKTKRGEATLFGANGVVRSNREAHVIFVEGPNHPVCAVKERDILFVAQPPLLGKAELSKLRLDGNVNCN